MEVGDIKRFKTDGDFASYCRMVDARHLSNGKQKAENNQKCGNKYLAWAFVMQLSHRLDGASKTDFFEIRSPENITWQMSPTAGTAIGAGWGNALKSWQKCQK